MNSEQQKQCRAEFEIWLNKTGLELTAHQRRIAISAFQAAYTPMPKVEVVAKALQKVQDLFDTEARDLAQAAIDAIFNKPTTNEENNNANS